MQVLYEPLTFGGCFTNMAVLAAIAIVIGLVLAFVFRWLVRFSPVWEWIARGALAFGVIAACGIVLLLSTTDAATVRVAIDGSYLEYKYCKGMKTMTDSWPLAQVGERKYRRVVANPGTSRKRRISHFIDIHVPDREKPIIIELDSVLAETDLELVAKFAPEAYAQFELNRHKRR